MLMSLKNQEVDSAGTLCISKTGTTKVKKRKRDDGPAAEHLDKQEASSPYETTTVEVNTRIKKSKPDGTANHLASKNKEKRRKERNSESLTRIVPNIIEESDEKKKKRKKDQVKELDMEDHGSKPSKKKKRKVKDDLPDPDKDPSLTDQARKGTRTQFVLPFHTISTVPPPR